MFCALINWSSELVAVVSNLCLQSMSSLASQSQSVKTHAPPSSRLRIVSNGVVLYGAVDTRSCFFTLKFGLKEL